MDNPPVTPATLRTIAGEFEFSATTAISKAWPAIAEHDRAIAANLRKAADILEQDHASAEKR